MQCYIQIYIHMSIQLYIHLLIQIYTHGYIQTYIHYYIHIIVYKLHNSQYIMYGPGDEDSLLSDGVLMQQSRS